MKNHKWITLALVVCVLLTQLALPTAALADDNAPPPDVLVVDTPVVDDPVMDAPVVDEPVVVEPLTVAEVLTDLPEDAPVVVLDENNQPVPLATQEAAETIAVSDPIFCTGNEAPHGTTTGGVYTSDNGCSNSYKSLKDLLTAHGAANETDVTIYFTSDYIANDMTIDNTALDPAIKWKGNLFLQGGWNTGTNSQSGRTNFVNVPINISWIGNVFINDINLNRISSDSSVHSALSITTTKFETYEGDIYLENVKVENSDSTGIVLNGTDITLKNVDATKNIGSGISVEGANITLNNVSADDNRDYGIFLSATKDINLKDVAAVSNNKYDGISAYGADVTLEDVTANENNWKGIFIEGTNITLKNVTADNNKWDGARLNIDDGSAGLISVTGGSFSGNMESSGIKIVQEDVDETKIFVGTGLTVSDNDYAGIDPSSNGAFSIECDNNTLFVHTGNGSGGAIDGYDEDCKSLSDEESETPPTDDPSETPATPPSTSEPGDDGESEDHGKSEDYGTESAIKHLQVANGQTVELSCGGGVTGYELENYGNRVSLPCGSLASEDASNSASVSLLTDTQLPAKLDSQYTYVAGLNFNISTPLKGSGLVSFIIPADTFTSSYTILFWDGSNWIDLGGYLSTDGLFKVSTSQAGMYVLVTK